MGALIRALSWLSSSHCPGQTSHVSRTVRATTVHSSPLLQARGGLEAGIPGLNASPTVLALNPWVNLGINFLICKMRTIGVPVLQSH